MRVFFRYFVEKAKPISSRILFEWPDEVEKDLEGEEPSDPAPPTNTNNSSTSKSPVPFTITNTQKLGFLRELDYFNQYHCRLANIAYTRGEKAHVRCVEYKASPDTYKECVLIGVGKWEGACTHCYLKKNAEKCTHYCKCSGIARELWL